MEPHLKALDPVLYGYGVDEHARIVRIGGADQQMALLRRLLQGGHPTGIVHHVPRAAAYLNVGIDGSDPPLHDIRLIASKLVHAGDMSGKVRRLKRIHVEQKESPHPGPGQFQGYRPPKAATPDEAHALAGQLHRLQQAGVSLVNRRSHVDDLGDDRHHLPLAKHPEPLTILANHSQNPTRQKIDRRLAALPNKTEPGIFYTGSGNEDEALAFIPHPRMLGLGCGGSPKILNQPLVDVQLHLRRPFPFPQDILNGALIDARMTNFSLFSIPFVPAHPDVTVDAVPSAMKGDDGQEQERPPFRLTDFPRRQDIQAAQSAKASRVLMPLPKIIPALRPPVVSDPVTIMRHLGTKNSAAKEGLFARPAGAFRMDFKFPPGTVAEASHQDAAGFTSGGRHGLPHDAPQCIQRQARRHLPAETHPQTRSLTSSIPSLTPD